MSLFVYLSVVICVVCAIYYVYFKNKLNYWRKKGIKGPAPLPLAGNFLTVLLQRQSVSVLLKDIYKKYPNEKVVGLYQGTVPALLIKDPVLIKKVLIKDFANFQDRGVRTSNSPLSNNLFSAEGEMWQILRQKLTPTFTSKKLKDMIPLIDKCLENFVAYVDTLAENKTHHEIRSLTAKYTLQVIGSCVFGVHMDTYAENNEFYMMGKKVFNPSTISKMWTILEMLIPGIRKAFGNLSDTSSNITKFFLDFVQEVIKSREGKTLSRRDFMDLMIELRREGRASQRKEDGVKEIEIDDGIIVAQAFVYFSAGFDTSSATMSFMIHELAINPHVQNKVYNELQTVAKKYNGKINYEALSELQYLEKVFDETLRKFSVAGALRRVSLTDYTFPGTDISIDKGTPIYVAIRGLHEDPQYYPEPNRFNPENFSPENKQEIPQCAYLPFGDGPRNCIGMRFAKIETMMGMVAIIQNFRIERCEKTMDELALSPVGLTLTSRDGIYVNIVKR